MALLGLPTGSGVILALLLCPGVFSFLSFVLLVVFLVRQRPQQVSAVPPTPHIQPSILAPDAAARAADDTPGERTPPRAGDAPNPEEADG